MFAIGLANELSLCVRSIAAKRLLDQNVYLHCSNNEPQIHRNARDRSGIDAMWDWLWYKLSRCSELWTCIENPQKSNACPWRIRICARPKYAIFKKEHGRTARAWETRRVDQELRSTLIFHERVGCCHSPPDNRRIVGLVPNPAWIAHHSDWLDRTRVRVRLGRQTKTWCHEGVMSPKVCRF